MTVPAIPNEGFGGVPGVEPVPSGLLFSPDLPFDSWTQVGGLLAHHRNWSSFAIGDWLNHGEKFYDEFSQGAEALKKEPATLLEFQRVARRIPIERRRPQLEWSHHQAVASMNDADQERWLDRAEAEQWSVSDLRAELKALREPGTPRRLGHGGSQDAAALIEYMERVGRDVLDAADPVRSGYAEVPNDVLDRLANAVGTTRADADADAEDAVAEARGRPDYNRHIDEQLIPAAKTVKQDTAVEARWHNYSQTRLKRHIAVLEGARAKLDILIAQAKSHLGSVPCK